jgi:hypothetical protein
MYNTAEEIMDNLTFLPDITHEELLTAVIGLCSKVVVMQEEIERLRNGKN